MNPSISRQADESPRKARVFRAWDFVVFPALTAVNLAALAYFLVYWVRLDDWHTRPGPVLVVSLVLAYQLSISFFRWFMLPAIRRPVHVPPRPGLRVGVATTFVPSQEPLDMLEKTLAALVNMRYPHDTWVLDEGDDPAVRDLCARLGARHFTRKGREVYQQPEGAFAARTKHGNYNAWLTEHAYGAYDIVVGFDPDHIPLESFLERVLGYFDADAVGYVQAAQAYYNQPAGFIARGGAEETYAYYSVTQMAGFAMGFPIVVGCHNVHRASALREVGGFAAHDADDLLITFLYRHRGWQGVYVPEVLARGLTPVDWPSYFAQQLRWTRSVLDIKFREFPRVAGQLPLKTRLMGFLHGMFYIQDGICLLVTLCLLSFLLITGATPAFLSYLTVERLLLLFAALQISDFYRQRFFLDRRSECGLHWRAGFLRYAKWPFVLLGFIEAVAGRRRPYSLTAKVRSAQRSHSTRPHLWMAGILAASWSIGLCLGHTHHPLLLAWAGVMVVLSLIVAWTETWAFPPPFQRQLADREV